MKTIGKLKFADTIGVMYAIKELKKCNTLQETYKHLDVKDVDGMLEILNISYNKANPETPLEFMDFVDLLDLNGVSGLYAVGKLYGDIVESLMFNGLTPEEVAERKNQLTNLMKS